MQRSFDVAWNIEMHLVVLVVPIEGDVNIKFSLPVMCDCVILLEGRN